MCTEGLRHQTCGKRRKLKFCVKMVCREPINHFDDCYFCASNITGINKNNHQKWKYPDLAYARRPVPVLDNIQIPSFHILQDISEDEIPTSNFDIDSDYTAETSSLNLFNQNELNDLIRNLSLSKETSELLASRLKEKNQLVRGTKITTYLNREKYFLPFYCQENYIVFCKDTRELIINMGVEEHSPTDWRLFIDSSKRSLKCVLLHNGNKYGSIPIAHSIKMKEEYETIAFIVKKIIGKFVLT